MSGDEALLAAWTLDEWQESTQMKYWSPTVRGLRHTTLRSEDETTAVSMPARESEERTGATTSIFGYDAVVGFEIGETPLELDSFDGALTVIAGTMLFAGAAVSG